MEQAYLEDLEHATEIVLDMTRPRFRRPRMPRLRRGGEAPPSPPANPTRGTARASGARGPSPRPSGGRGSAGRAAAGAIRIGNTIGAAITDRRLLGPVEARLATFGGALLIGLALLFALFPPVLAYPVALLAAWGGVALVIRGVKLWRQRRRSPERRP